MKRQTLFLGIFAAAMLTMPAFAADDNAGITGVRWGRTAFGYEPLPSGPQPVTNLKQSRDGTGDGAQLVGDYNNQNLKPAAAAAVKQMGELASAGKGFPDVSDQCRPYAPPFTFAMQLSFHMLQNHNGDITIIYNQDDNVRHIRMNAAHPADLVPSPWAMRWAIGKGRRWSSTPWASRRTLFQRPTCTARRRARRCT